MAAGAVESTRFLAVPVSQQGAYTPPNACIPLHVYNPPAELHKDSYLNIRSCKKSNAAIECHLYQIPVFQKDSITILITHSAGTRSRALSFEDLET